MSEPITWQAIQRIALQLAAILPANGYLTSIGQNVDLEPVQLDANTGARVLVGMQRLQVSELASRLRMYECTAVVEALVPASQADAQQQAHRAIADVLRVFPSSPQLFALAGAELEVAGDSADVLERPDGLNAVIAQVRLNLRIRESV